MSARACSAVRLFRATSLPTPRDHFLRNTCTQSWPSVERPTALSLKRCLTALRTSKHASLSSPLPSLHTVRSFSSSGPPRTEKETGSDNPPESAKSEQNASERSNEPPAEEDTFTPSLPSDIVVIPRSWLQKLKCAVFDPLMHRVFNERWDGQDNFLEGAAMAFDAIMPIALDINPSNVEDIVPMTSGPLFRRFRHMYYDRMRACLPANRVLDVGPPSQLLAAIAGWEACSTFRYSIRTLQVRHVDTQLYDIDILQRSTAHASLYAPENVRQLEQSTNFFVPPELDAAKLPEALQKRLHDAFEAIGLDVDHVNQQLHRKLGLDKPTPPTSHDRSSANINVPEETHEDPEDHSSAASESVHVRVPVVSTNLYFDVLHTFEIVDRHTNIPISTNPFRQRRLFLTSLVSDVSLDRELSWSFASFDEVPLPQH